MHGSEDSAGKQLTKLLIAEKVLRDLLAHPPRWQRRLVYAHVRRVLPFPLAHRGPLEQTSLANCCSVYWCPVEAATGYHAGVRHPPLDRSCDF